VGSELPALVCDLFLRAKIQLQRSVSERAIAIPHAPYAISRSETESKGDANFMNENKRSHKEDIYHL
jgi:hypothetical protein